MALEHNYSDGDQLLFESAQARVPGRSARRRLVVTFALTAAAALLGCLFLARARSTKADVRHSQDLYFKVTNYPDDCHLFLRFIGCKQDNWWSCDNKEDTNEWKCCCEDSLWFKKGTATSDRRQGLLKLANLETCVSAPKQGSSCRLSGCRENSTDLVMTLPLHGPGPIQLGEHKANRCLSVGEIAFMLESRTCAEGSKVQQFELDKDGRLKSHDGRCLNLITEQDSANALAEPGGHLGLLECRRWPAEQPSPTLEFARAPAALLSAVGEEDKKEAEIERLQPDLKPPKLYCCSLMLPWTVEVDLMKAQFKYSAGIFACDFPAVFSNERVELGKDLNGKPVYNLLMNGPLKVPFGGQAHTALNAPVFRRLWKRVIDEGSVWQADWIVKTDPDTVFMASRLKNMLRSRYPDGVASGPTWVNNCMLGLHGPIEVFNKKGLGVYKEAELNHQCDWVESAHPQEDVFMENCFQSIGVTKLNAYNTLLEWRWACMERSSTVDDRPVCFANQVAFHPFKTVKSYFHCLRRAMSQEKELLKHKMLPKDMQPTPENHHHDE